MALGLLCSNGPSSAWSESKGKAFENGPKTIASRDRVSVLIDREISEGRSSIVLKISVPTDSKINAFLLPDPPRVVIDFEGASIKKSENFQAPENGVIKQVRLGAHSNKLRVVVDLVTSTPPEYEWKAGKRQAIITFAEGPVEAPVAATQPTVAPTKQPEPVNQPTSAPSPTAASVAAKPTETPAPPTASPTHTSPPTLADVAPKDQKPPPTAEPSTAAKQVAQLPLDSEEVAVKDDLGDLEQRRAGPAPTKAPTTFSIKGYKFEYLPDKNPVLKIILNKPRSQAQISKVDAETYKIDIKDCGVENEDLELPQFPPHDFVGFVMVVSEVVGKNVEISVSVEDGVVLGTSVHENEIWVKKP